MLRRHAKSGFLREPGNFVAYRPKTGKHPSAFIIVSIGISPTLNYRPWGFEINSDGAMTVKNTDVFVADRIEKFARGNHIVYKIPIAEHLL